MSVQQLFYQTAVPVSFQRHKDLSVKVGDNYGFARQVNSAPITAVEFAQAAAEYPIVFAGDETQVFPAVVLGVRDSENLFVDADGRWKGTYIPAFVRRYPFVFSVDDTGKTFTLHIDEEFDGANRDGRGERLFDADGEHTVYLQGVLRFLQDFQARFARTQAFCAKLIEHKLLQPMQAQFALASGEKRTLAGFQVVDREKLKALPDAVLAELCRRDELECAYLHLASLRHFQDMLERFPREADPLAAPAAEGPAEGAAEDPATAESLVLGNSRAQEPAASDEPAEADARAET
jgi:hypothetical protein